MTANQIGRWELGGVRGAVVVVDVLRAFTTAAYAFDSGAEAIYLVADVDEALAFKQAHPNSVAVGEAGGLKPEGFDHPNSPASVAKAQLDGRTVVQRTSAGTQGVVDAVHADRLWAASSDQTTATPPTSSWQHGSTRSTSPWKSSPTIWASASTNARADRNVRDRRSLRRRRTPVGEDDRQRQPSLQPGTFAEGELR